MANTRRMVVLRAVVEDYIRTQEPVSSAAVARRHKISASPATVRNDMAALEDEGYLAQPHTSAGRVPTQKGYRYFVDKLATVMPLTPAQKNAIRQFLSGSVNLDDVLRRSAQLLAQITGQVAVVASPSLARSALRHLEIVPVALHTQLVVVITDTGRVEQRSIVNASSPSVEFVQRLCAQVNDDCTGLGLAATGGNLRSIALTLSDPAQREFTLSLAHIFSDLASQERASNLYMSGTNRLTHKEGALEDVAPLLDALEEQVVLMHLMGKLSEVPTEGAARGVGVAIGSETHTPGLLHASVVSSGYGHSSGSGIATDDAQIPAVAPVAFVGSIGPTHMDYATTIAAVRAVAKYLTEYVAREEGADPDGPAPDLGTDSQGEPSPGDFNGHGDSNEPNDSDGRNHSMTP